MRDYINKYNIILSGEFEFFVEFWFFGNYEA